MGVNSADTPFPYSTSLISFQQPQQAARNEFIYCICKFYTTFCSRCVLPPSLSPGKGVTRVYRCEYLPPPLIPCCRLHVAQKLIRFRYVESKLCQVFVTRSGASSMKPKVFASNTTPPDLRSREFSVFSGIGDWHWFPFGGVRGCQTVCQAAKLMCKYFHKFIFYSVKFGVSCLKTYKKFAQLIRVALAKKKNEEDHEEARHKFPI